MAGGKPSAADSLLGLDLDGGWKVVEKLEPRPGATGGYFSVGYLVRNEQGNTGFLKAIDFGRAFSEDVELEDGPDLLRTLQHLIEVYNFERDVLQKCRDRRLSRVATAVSDGSVSVKGFEPLSRVFYLIFELADGDARAHLDAAASLEVVWCFRTLQHVATGLKQLHWNGIAHQDLKPSNVLEYSTAGARVGDLGRASDRERVGPFDNIDVAGDKGYAPPEQLYGHRVADWHLLRCGCDAYLLGSLTYFFFSRASMTAAIMSRLHAGHTHLEWKGAFAEILPYVRQAFDEVIDEFSALASTQVGNRLAPDLVAIVRELCEPDPSLRGNPSSRSNAATQFNLDKYVTRFDVLAKRAAIYGVK